MSSDIVRLKSSKLKGAGVKPVSIKESDVILKPALGADWFAEPYANIFLCAKKKSGKTTVISGILDRCVDDRTHVYLFVSTAHLDAVWKQIRSNLEARGIAYTIESDVKRLGEILAGLAEEARALEESEREDKTETVRVLKEREIMKFDDSGSESDDEAGNSKSARRRRRTVAPEVCFVFDDLADQLRDPQIAYLLSKNRHFKSKVIISSQYWAHLTPASRTQLDYVLLFGRIPDDKLKMIYQGLDLGCSLKAFKAMYTYATKEPFSFLYIDPRRDEFRVSFTKSLKPIDD